MKRFELLPHHFMMLLAVLTLITPLCLLIGCASNVPTPPNSLSAYKIGDFVKVKLNVKKGQVTWYHNHPRFGPKYEVKYVNDINTIEEGTFYGYELEPWKE